jgi:hypothetical protein
VNQLIKWVEIIEIKIREIIIEAAAVVDEAALEEVAQEISDVTTEMIKTTEANGTQTSACRKQKLE